MTCLFLWLPKAATDKKSIGALPPAALSDLSTALRDVTRDDGTNAAKGHAEAPNIQELSTWESLKCCYFFSHPT